MYKPIESSLKWLSVEFDRCARSYPPLWHEMWWAPELEPISQDEWKRVIRENRDEEWDEWQVLPGQAMCSRFIGHDDGVHEYKALAESLYLVMCELDQNFPQHGGYLGALDAVHDMASSCPTPLLRVKSELWAENAFKMRLVNNVFTSTLAAVRLMLEPDAVLLVGDLLGDGPTLPMSLEDTSFHNATDNTATPSQDELSVDATPYLFRPESDGLRHIRFTFEEKVEEYRIADLEGLKHFAILLQRPCEHIESSELLGIDPDRPVDMLSFHEAIDEETIKTVKKRVDFLRKQQTEKAEREIEELKQHIEKSLNKQGQGRHIGPAPVHERARKSVGANLRYARKKICDRMPNLEKHLADSVRPNGTMWSYRPGRTIHWRF